MTPPTQIKLMRLCLASCDPSLLEPWLATKLGAKGCTCARVRRMQMLEPTRNEPTPKTNNRRGQQRPWIGTEMGTGNGNGTGTKTATVDQAKRGSISALQFCSLVAFASFHSCRCRCRLSLHFDTITRTAAAAGQNRANHLWQCAGARHLIKYMTGH